MKKTITKLISSFAVCLMMIYAGTTSAATYTAVASGNWSSGTTWDGGIAPPSNITGDEIVIGVGFVVNLDQDITLNRTGLFASASLNVNGELRGTEATRQISMIRGELNGDGTVQAGIIEFQSTSTVGFTGTIIAEELRHSLASLISTADFDVRKQLSLMGALSIGSQLKIASDARITIDGGSLVTAGNGSISFNGPYDVMYLNATVTAGPEMGGAELRDVLIDIGASNNVVLTSNAVINGKLTLTSGELRLNDRHLTIKGTVVPGGSGTIGSTSSSDFTLEGSGSLEGELRFNQSRHAIRNFTLSRDLGDSSLKLSSDLEVSGILNLDGGSIYVGNNTLDIVTGGSITGASEEHYIMTGATGRLGMLVTSGGSFVMFPVGTKDEYAPAAVRLTSGASGMVRINNIDKVYANGTAGADLSASEKMVKSTWNVTSDLTAAFALDLKVMWSGSMEANSFDRSKAFISHYAGGSWDVMASAAATEENGMHTITRAGITTLSPFAVFESGATGIADIHAISSASVYPNPATDYIMINNVEHVTIEIVNALGQVVKTGELNGSAPLNLSDLERGNYFIKISSEDASTVKKFVKL